MAMIPLPTLFNSVTSQIRVKIFVVIYLLRIKLAGLILGLRPANERRSYEVTPSLIGWAQTQNQSVVSIRSENDQRRCPRPHRVLPAGSLDYPLSSVNSTFSKYHSKRLLVCKFRVVEIDLCFGLHIPRQYFGYIVTLYIDI